MAESAQAWDTTSDYDRTDQLPQQSQPKGGGQLNLRPEDALKAKLDLLLQKKLQSLDLRSTKAVEVACALCQGTEHETSVCPSIPAFKEIMKDPNEVNAVGTNNFNIVQNGGYNPQNRNHQNFSYKPQDQRFGQMNNYNQGQGFNQNQTVQPYRAPPFNNNYQPQGGGFQNKKMDQQEGQLSSITEHMQQLMQMQMAAQ